MTDKLARLKLARFRADPSRVKVSVRQCGRFWLGSVCARGFVEDVDTIYVYYDVNPKIAVLTALKQADDAGVEGVDMYMQWTYPHPHGEPKRWDGLCSEGLHGLDYQDQECDLCDLGWRENLRRPNPT